MIHAYIYIGVFKSYCHWIMDYMKVIIQILFALEDMYFNILGFILYILSNIMNAIFHLSPYSASCPHKH